MKETSFEGPGAALDLGPREHLAMVGGGGKTTLLVTLMREFAREGIRVLAATTTKVWHREVLEAAPLVLTDQDGWQDALDRFLETEGMAFLGRRVLPTGKVEGIPPELADLLFTRNIADTVLVEADGAAGRPLKAPGPLEPVIPGTVTGVVAVAGLEVLDRPMEEDLVFRLERVQEITGLARGSRMSEEAVSRLFSHRAGLFQGTPERARKMVFLNKMDRLAHVQAAHGLGRRILEEERSGVSTVVLGSLRQGPFLRLRRT